MIEKNDLFDYGYYIYQNKEYFKFSIDSILLAEFVSFKKNDTILDMCTGNAPIPMILTSKNKNLKIDAVEIQKEIYDLAIKSININNLSNINIYNCDIKEYKPNKKYDIITCNPPYFKVNNKSLLNLNTVKKIARHEIMLKLEEVISIACNLLEENGKLYLVHRNERLLETLDFLKSKKFGIRRICFVFTGSNTNSEFFLIEASKQKKSDPKVTYLNIEQLSTYKNIFEEA